jgi:pimeloyl-ACP methyl ester carboxylesterase
MFADLDRIQCRTLVLGGEDDPSHPIESQAARRISPPPCRRISCSSSGLQIAGTPSSLTHPSAPWP